MHAHGTYTNRFHVLNKLLPVKFCSDTQPLEELYSVRHFILLRTVQIPLPVQT